MMMIRCSAIFENGESDSVNIANGEDFGENRKDYPRRYKEVDEVKANVRYRLGAQEGGREEACRFEQPPGYPELGGHARFNAYDEVHAFIT